MNCFSVKVYDIPKYSLVIPSDAGFEMCRGDGKSVERRISVVYFALGGESSWFQKQCWLGQGIVKLDFQQTKICIKKGLETFRSVADPLKGPPETSVTR